MRHISILLCCIYSILAAGKDYPMVHYGQKDGLPSNMVYHVYQDDDGYIWFATDKGIAKYNGLKFQRYTANEGLSDNECFFFRKDYEGRLWISTYNGTLMYYKDGVFHTAKNTPFLQLPVKDGLTGDIHVEKDSSITISFRSRLNIISILHNKLNAYSLTEINKRFESYSMLDIRKTGPSTFDLYYIDHKVTIDHNAQIIANTPYKKDITLRLPSIRADQRYYISEHAIYTEDFSLYKLLPKNFFLQHYIHNIYTVQNHCFIATNHGLWIDGIQTLQKHRISSVNKDQEGNYWICTLDDGVYKMSSAFLSSGFIAQAYPEKVKHVAAYSSKLIITTSNRNTYWLSNDSMHTLFDYLQKSRQNLPPVNPSGQLLFHDQYWNFGRSANGTGYNYIFKALDKPVPQIARIHLFERYYKNEVKGKNGAPTGISSCTVRNLFAHGNFIYINSISQLLTVPVHAFTMGQPLFPLKIFPTRGQVSSDAIYGITQSPDSNLWFSTINQVYKVIDSIPLKQNQFGNHVFKTMIINKDYLVGTTMDNKLVICNQYADNHIYIDTNINNDCIWDKFYPINDSVILATTNDYYRLITTRPAQGKPQYTIRILENQFVPQLAEYVFSDETSSYFFKDQSITKVSVADLLNAPATARLQFTTIKTKDTSYTIDSFIQLSFNTSRDISINFNTFSFNTTAINYEYSISNGTDNTGEWQKSNGENINLFKIGSGTYNIRIRAKTFGGTYSQVQSFVLSIGKPFWFSWWFTLLCLLAIGVIGYAILRYYTRSVANKKEAELKFLKSEFTALNALMNPHFIFNTLNSVQSLINRDNKQEASEHIRTVADLIRQNMHNVSRDQISLENEITLVANYLRLEQLRFPWLNFTINNEEDIELDDIMIPPLMIQPLVENAIIHGLWPAKPEHGHIRIDIYRTPGQVCIDITDNGRGFVADKNRDSSHQSTALSNISKRLNQLSALHGRQFLFAIHEMKDNEGKVIGVKATICIEKVKE